MLARTGPRPLIPTGMLLASLGMVLLTRIGVDTAYASHVLPSLILIGVGFGLVVAPSFATATLGVPRHDSGVASAMVSTSQQVGGSIGTALLSTLAVVGRDRLSSPPHGPGPTGGGRGLRHRLLVGGGDLRRRRDRHRRAAALGREGAGARRLARAGGRLTAGYVIGWPSPSMFPSQSRNHAARSPLPPLLG